MQTVYESLYETIYSAGHGTGNAGNGKQQKTTTDAPGSGVRNKAYGRKALERKEVLVQYREVRAG